MEGHTGTTAEDARRRYRINGPGATPDRESQILERASSRRIRFLAAPASREAHRRISAGFIVEAAGVPSFAIPYARPSLAHETA